MEKNSTPAWRIEIHLAAETEQVEVKGTACSYGDGGAAACYGNGGSGCTSQDEGKWAAPTIESGRAKVGDT